MRKNVLGFYRSARPLGVIDSPRRNIVAVNITSNLQPQSIRARVTERATRVKGVELFGPLPEQADDGFTSDYDVSEYTIFYYPNKSGISSCRYQFDQREKKSRSPRKGNYQVFFVNGMQGNPEKFRAQACATAAVSGGQVSGVFNAGSGFASDLFQCTTDKLFSNDWLNLKVETWKLFGNPTQAEIENYVFNSLRESNACAAALYKELLTSKGEARIVAHSQGNIIMCNAVNGIYAARGSQGVRNIKLYAVASPVVFWSNAKSCLKRGAELNFSNDAIAWLGFNGGDESYLQGWSASDNKKKYGQSEITESYQRSRLNLTTHQFYIYLERYWKILQAYFE